MSKEEKKLKESTKSKLLKAKYRATFLSNENGREVLWNILINVCGIYQKIHTQGNIERHNIGLEILEMCGLVDDVGNPKQIFDKISNLKTKKPLLKRIGMKLRRKKWLKQQK